MGAMGLQYPDEMSKRLQCEFRSVLHCQYFRCKYNNIQLRKQRWQHEASIPWILRMLSMGAIMRGTSKWTIALLIHRFYLNLNPVYDWVCFEWAQSCVEQAIELLPFLSIDFIWTSIILGTLTLSAAPLPNMIFWWHWKKERSGATHFSNDELDLEVSDQFEGLLCFICGGSSILQPRCLILRSSQW